jgi:hypothetical protein
MPGDNFVDRVPVAGQSSLFAGANLNATREIGEPLHAGKPGGRSVWYTWLAPITGIAYAGSNGRMTNGFDNSAFFAGIRGNPEIAKQKGIDGYKLAINVGKSGGQEVPYLHLHFLSDQKA